MELLTVQETARLMRVPPVTIRRAIADGRLPAVKVGMAVRVRKEAIDAMVKPIDPGKSTKPKSRRKRTRPGRPFTFDDPLWNIVSMITSDGPGDVARNQPKYLAEAYAAKHDSSDPQ